MSEQQTTIDAALEERRAEVARQFVEVGRSLHAFDYKRKQYLPRAIDRAMNDAECAFDAGDYDHAEHLAKVVACMVRREAPRFALDPPKWIARLQAREEDQTPC